MTQAVTSNEVSSSWPTLYEIGKTILKMDLTAHHTRRGGRPNAEFISVVDDLELNMTGLIEGTYMVSPEKLAGVRVPLLERNANNHIVGFQRPHSVRHARDIARELLDGKETVPITISIFPNGHAYVTDGQHRALGAIISRVPIRVDVKQRSVAEARELFVNQRKARKLSQDQIILSGASPIEVYIQDAVTNPEHPWHELIGFGMAGGDKKFKMTPTAAVAVIGQFAFNAYTTNTTDYCTREEGFDSRRADQMARLLKAFGTKKTNELAYRSAPLRAIAAAAVSIFFRNPNVTSTDEARWMRHMATFDFAQYPYLLNKDAKQLANLLIHHWNKRLSEDRKVPVNG